MRRHFNVAQPQWGDFSTLHSHNVETNQRCTATMRKQFNAAQSQCGDSSTLHSHNVETVQRCTATMWRQFNAAQPQCGDSSTLHSHNVETVQRCTVTMWREFTFILRSKEIRGFHLIDLGKVKSSIELGATKWFWTQDFALGTPAP